MVNGLHLYSAFIQSALQFLPLIHPFTHTFTHQRQLAAMQGTNQLVRSNWGLGVLLRDTSTRPGWDRTGNPPTARRQLLPPEPHRPTYQWVISWPDRCVWRQVVPYEIERCWESYILYYKTVGSIIIGTAWFSNICKVACFINDLMESTKVLHFPQEETGSARIGTPELILCANTLGKYDSHESTSNLW